MELLLIGSHCFIRAPTRDRPSCHDTMHGPKLPKLLLLKPKRLLLPQTNSSQFMMLFAFASRSRSLLVQLVLVLWRAPDERGNSPPKKKQPNKKEGLCCNCGLLGPFLAFKFIDHTVPMFTYVLSCVAPATPKPKKSKLKLKDTRLPVRHRRSAGNL